VRKRARIQPLVGSKFFFADETGGDKVVVGGSRREEGMSVWEAGEVYMAGEEADPQPEGQRWDSTAGM
jgi:hypothetical protein